MPRPPFQAPHVQGPPKQMPGGSEPFVPPYGAPPAAEIPPDSSSGNDQYTLVYVTDDQANYAPVDDDGEVVGVGYQS